MKPNGIGYLAKLDMANVSGWLLLRQHESEHVFTFPLLTSECGLFQKSANKYCIFRVGWTQETLVFYL